MSKEVFMGLAHIGIFTDKYDESLKFYTEVLPFTLVKELYEEKPGDTSGFSPLKFAIFKLNDLYIEIMECADKRNGNGIKGVFHHIGIRVTDIEAAIAYLIERGVPADNLPLPPAVNTTLYPGKIFRSRSLTGPNGEHISLYEINNKEYFDES